MKKKKHAPKKTAKSFRKKEKKAVRTPEKKAAKAAEKRPSPIEFCEKCGAIMIPIKKGKQSYIKCRSCGREQKKEIRGLKIVEESPRTRGVIVLEKDPTLLPLTDKECPQCEHEKAYWWMQQTRSADEPPTQFFRCEKCKHTWREYK